MRTKPIQKHLFSTSIALFAIGYGGITMAAPLRGKPPVTQYKAVGADLDSAFVETITGFSKDLRTDVVMTADQLTRVFSDPNGFPKDVGIDGFLVLKDKSPSVEVFFAEYSSDRSKILINFSRNFQETQKTELMEIPLDPTRHQPTSPFRFVTTEGEFHVKIKKNEIPVPGLHFPLINPTELEVFYPNDPKDTKLRAGLILKTRTALMEFVKEVPVFFEAAIRGYSDLRVGQIVLFSAEALVQYGAFEIKMVGGQVTSVSKTQVTVANGLGVETTFKKTSIDPQGIFIQEPSP